MGHIAQFPGGKLPIDLINFVKDFFGRVVVDAEVHIRWARNCVGAAVFVANVQLWDDGAMSPGFDFFVEQRARRTAPTESPGRSRLASEVSG